MLLLQEPHLLAQSVLWKDAQPVQEQLHKHVLNVVLMDIEAEVLLLVVQLHHVLNVLLDAKPVLFLEQPKPAALVLMDSIIQLLLLQ
jgi:hypothetical protein